MIGDLALNVIKKIETNAPNWFISGRGFSKSGITVTRLKNGFNPETVRYLMC